MSHAKQSKRKALLSWLDKIQDKSPSRYKLSELKNIPEAYIESMTTAQLDFVLKLISCAYSMGAEESRAFRRSLKEQRYSKAIGAFTVKLKAIPGGRQ